MGTGQVDSGAVHPLESMLAGLRTVVPLGVDAPMWTLAPDRLTVQLPELHEFIRQLQAIELAGLREADRHQVGDPNGFANTVGWWSAVTRSTKAEARRELKLAERLDADEHQAVRAAALGGEVSLD